MTLICSIIGVLVAIKFWTIELNGKDFKSGMFGVIRIESWKRALPVVVFSVVAVLALIGVALHFYSTGTDSGKNSNAINADIFCLLSASLALLAWGMQDAAMVKQHLDQAEEVKRVQEMTSTTRHRAALRQLELE